MTTARHLTPISDHLAEHAGACIELVRLAYGPAGCLDFRQRMPDIDTLATCLRTIGGYNNFDGHRIAADLTGSDTTGTESASDYQLGREGSPVLYIGIPYWSHQSIRARRDGWHHLAERERLTPAERAVILTGFAHWAHLWRADEITAELPGGEHEMIDHRRPIPTNVAEHAHKIRLWWD